MKRNLILILTIFLISVIPAVLASDTSIGVTIDITTEEFAPLIWQCDNRVVLEDCVEAGRLSDCPQTLVERGENYAFEGEQIGFDVLVMDKNKIEEIQEVAITIGQSQGVGNDIEVECYRIDDADLDFDFDSCNARILEEELTDFDEATMGYYRCLLTVETPESMYGEHYVTAEVISVDGEAIMDENEYWFFNPVLALSISDSVEFADGVRPGTASYSNTILIGNEADDGSGVMMDMFISGTDFYDPLDSGARCPTTNRLKLSQNLRSQADLGASFDQGLSRTTECNIDDWLTGGSGGPGEDNNDHLCYYATNGAYSTADADNSDLEGYVPIVYGDVFSRDFYNDAEIIRNAGPDASGDLVINTIEYHAGNTLSPGSEIALNFKLGLPEPCTGDFSTGDIFFWGEAI